MCTGKKYGMHHLFNGRNFHYFNHINVGPLSFKIV